MDDVNGEKKQKGIRTFEDDVASEGGTFDDEGVVFETPAAQQTEDEADTNEPAAEKPDSEANEREATYKQPRSILTNKDDVFDVSGAFSGDTEAGTIITDKKHTRKSLGARFVDALTEWVEIAKESAENTKLVKKEKKKLPRVAPARARKETIQKASEKAALAPTDDHRAVVEHIRTLDRDAERITGKPFLIKETPAEAPTWTHTKDDAEKKAAATPAAKAKLAPGTERSFVAPEVSERTGELKRLKKEEAAAQKKEEEAEPEIITENLVSPESERVTAPVFARRSTPSESRREKARQAKEKEEEKKEKQKGSRWRRLFQNIGFGMSGKKGATEKRGYQAALERDELAKLREDEARAQAELRQEPRDTEVETGAATGYASADMTDAQVETVSQPPSQPPTPPEEPEFHGVGEEEPEKPQPSETPAAAEQEGVPEEPKPRQPQRKIYFSDKKTEVRRSALPWRKILVTAVIVIAVAGGIGTSYMFFSQQRSPSELPTPFSPVVSFIPTDDEVALVLPDSRSALLRALDEQVNAAGSGITQIYPVVRETRAGGTVTERPATTQEIFTRIDPRVPSAFIRSLREDMMLGSVSLSENEPFIIIRSNNFDTAFAGMLDWEPFISSDLAPLFGPPVSRTFDENARTIDQSINAVFTDVVVANTGARVLFDSANTERITYAFKDRNTIVITTTTDALERLLGELR